MSGHSQFKNIMYRKGAQDAKKAKVFAKLARDITIAAKSGLPEPDKNPRLRLAIQAARAESMPKDNIERALPRPLRPPAATITYPCVTKASAPARSQSSSKR